MGRDAVTRDYGSDAVRLLDIDGRFRGLAAGQEERRSVARDQLVDRLLESLDALIAEHTDDLRLQLIMDRADADGAADVQQEIYAARRAEIAAGFHRLLGVAVVQYRGAWKPEAGVLRRYCRRHREGQSRRMGVKTT